MEFWIFLMLFVLIAPVVIYIAISVHKKHSQSTGDIINYDAFMNKYVYKVPMTKSEIISTLNVRNVADELSCNLDQERAVMVFSDYDDSIEYFFFIQEQDGVSILKLQQVSAPIMYTRSYIPYKLNPFMGISCTQRLSRLSITLFNRTVFATENSGGHSPPLFSFHFSAAPFFWCRRGRRCRCCPAGRSGLPSRSRYRSGAACRVRRSPPGSGLLSWLWRPVR